MQTSRVKLPLADPTVMEYWGRFALSTLARANLSFMALCDIVERNDVTFGSVASFGAGSCTHETAMALMWPEATVHCFDITDSYIPDYTKSVFMQRPNIRFREW